MWRFILLTFAFLGWAGYELSGGNDFEPIVRAAPAPEPETVIVAEASKPVPTKPVETVTRAAVVPTEAEIKPTPAVLTNVPTTNRLVSVPTPTPEAEVAKLGPRDTQASTLVPMRTKKVSAISLATVPEVDPDFRRVSGDRVNMRNGPGTNYSVIGKLYRDDEVEVFEESGTGWVRLQSMETGRVGWMAARLLTKIQY